MLAPTGALQIIISYNIVLSKCIQASIVHAPARLHMSTIALQILQCTNCTIHIYRAPTNKESNASRNAPTPLGGAFSHLFSTQTLPLMQFLPSRLLVPRGACATRLPGRRKAPGSGGNLSFSKLIQKTFIKEGLPINLQNQQQGMASKLKSLGKGVKNFHFKSLILF